MSGTAEAHSSDLSPKGISINTTLLIQLRVQKAQAEAALKQFQGQYRQLTQQMSVASNTSARMFGGQTLSGINAFSGSMRSAGYALSTAFTYPLVAAGKKLTDYVLETQKSFAQLSKVYGSDPFGDYSADLGKLQKLFAALSNEFGVNVNEVTDVAAAWAAAGVSGAALGKSVETTLKASIVGDMSAAEAAKSLISIQAQYGASASDLIDILNTMNSVENATAISMQGLIQGFDRAAGAASNFGVDARHLTAFLAALSPAAGTPAIAGNALKSIMTNLIAPTQNATDILEKLGFQVDANNWKTLTATERIEQLARQYKDLPSAQQGVVGKYIATNYQINRFSVVMQDVNNGLDQQEKRLKALATAVQDTGNNYDQLNGLLANPPIETSDFFKTLGLEIDSSSFTMLSATERLESMSVAYKNLTGPQKEMIDAQAQASLGLNNFRQLMTETLTAVEDTSSGLSYYNTALQASINPIRNAQTAARELNTVLSSNPHMIQQMTVIMKNAMATAIVPLIPVLLSVIRYIAHLAEAFANLNPALQKFIGITLATLAILGPMILYMMAVRDALGGIFLLLKLVLAPLKIFTLGWALLAPVLMRSIALLRIAALTIMVNLRVALLFVPGMAAAAGRAMVVFATVAWGALQTLTVWMVTVLPGILTTALGAMRGFAATAVLFLQGIPVLAAAGWAQFMMFMRGIPIIAAAWWSSFSLFMQGIPVIIAATWAQFQLFLQGIPVIVASTWAGFRAFMIGLPATIAAAWGTFKLFMQGIPVIISATWASFSLFVRGIPVVLAATWSAFSLFMQGIPVVIAATWAQFRLLMQSIPVVVAATWSAFRAFMITLPATLTAAWGTFRLFLQGIPVIVAATWSAFQAFMVALPAVLTVVWTNFMLFMRGIPVIIAASWAALGAFMATMPRIIAASWAVFSAFVAAIPAILAGIIPAVSAIGTAIVAALTNPWVLAALAIILVVVAFKDKIRELFSNLWNNIANNGPLKSAWQGVQKLFASGVNMIHRAFNALPNGIQNALMSVVNLVKTAALKVYELFSYLNPFAHHSPSLVENVTKGMEEVARQFGTVTNVRGPILAAYADIQKFGGAIAALKATSQGMDLASALSSIRDAGLGDGVIEMYKTLTQDLGPLQTKLEAVSAVMNTQQQIVDAEQRKVTAANDALNAMQKVMDGLQRTQQQWQNRIADTNEAIDKFASSGIAGQRAMEDQIFANTMAQKALQLQMMQIEQVTGPIDDVKSKMADLNGEILTLQGTRAGLQAGGAGSEILSVYDAQIKKVREQQTANTGLITQYEALNKQLDELGRKGQMLDLENSLKFDPLTRQVQQLKDGLNELPFDDIMAGIKSNQAALAGYTAEYDRATAAVEQQQAAIDAATATRDALQATLDAEQGKLDTLRASYDQVNDAITAVNESLQVMSDNAQKATAAMEAAKQAGASGSQTIAAQNFDAAAGGDFPDANLGASIQDAGFADSLDKQIDEAMKSVSDKFGALDFLSPFKGAWKKVTDWWGDSVGPIFSNLWDGLFGEEKTVKVFDYFNGGWTDKITQPLGVVKQLWSDFNDMLEKSSGSDVAGWLGKLGDILRDIAGYVGEFAKRIWEAISPDVISFFKELWGAVQNLANTLWDQLQPLLKSIGELFQALWPVIKVIAGVIGVGLVMSWKILSEIFTRTVFPVLNVVIDIIGNIIQFIRGFIEVLTGVINFLVGVFTGDWDKAWQGILQIGKGVTDQIGAVFQFFWNILKGIGEAIWGVVSGLVMGIVHFFQWLYDILVGHSIIPDLMNAIMGWFEWIWEGIKFVLGKIGDFFVWIWNGIKDAFWTVIHAIEDAYNWVHDRVFLAIQIAIALVKATWDTIWNAVLTVWNTTWNAVRDAWNWINENVMKAIAIAIWVVKNTWDTVWGAVKSTWDKLWDALSTTWNLIKSNVFDAFSSAIGAVKDAFHTAVEGIKTAWDGIQEATKAPIRFVVDTVLNKGLIAGFNWISDKVGGPHVNDITLPPGFADGGKISVPGGGGPRADGILGIDRKTKMPTSFVSNDEFVVNANQTRKHLGFLNALNAGKIDLPMLADGGQPLLVNQMMQFVRFKFPSAVLNSGLRPGANDYHGQGKAVDLGQPGGTNTGNQFYADMKNYLFDKVGKNTLELIYDGNNNARPDLKNGKEYNYGAALQAQHRNHVHWAINGIDAISKDSGPGFWDSVGSALGNAWDGITGALGGLNPINWLTDKMNGMLNGMPGGQVLKDIVTSVPKKLLTAAIDKVKSLIGDGSKSSAAPGGTGQLGAWEDQGLGFLNKPASWKGPLHTLIMRESGGNPRAINLTDSNAQRGTPSKGLMQLIDPTFQHWRTPSLSSDIYDPIANIVAGLNYITGKYGSIFNVQQADASKPPKGYDIGGLLMPGQGTYFNNTGKPEPVLTSNQWTDISRLARLGAERLASRTGGADATGTATIINNTDNSETTTIHIDKIELDLGDLGTPADARSFVENLETYLKGI